MREAINKVWKRKAISIPELLKDRIVSQLEVFYRQSGGSQEEFVPNAVNALGLAIEEVRNRANR